MNKIVICHKKFIMIHSLVYRLGYHEESYQLHEATIKQSYCCFFLINTWIIIPANKYEFLFHIIFSFSMSSFSNLYNVYSVL